MSNLDADPRGSGDVRRPVPSEWLWAAQTFLRTRLTSPDDALRMLASVGLDIDHLRVCGPPGRPEWGAGAAVCPGRTAVLHVPAAHPPADRTVAAARAVEQLAEAVGGAGAVILQAVVEPDAPVLPFLRDACGMVRIADLAYMELSVRRRPTPNPLPPGISVEQWTPENDRDFERAVAESYVQTLDCPGLSGLRTVRDSIEGHRAVGVFDPRHWLLARRGGGLAAVSLVGLFPQTAHAELCYLGVGHLHRRRGIAAAILTESLRRAADAGCPRLVLAVDTTNAPALALYHRFGFRRLATRAAMLRPIKP